MHKDAAVVVLESLASGVRLDVYRLLVRKGPEGLVASEIAAALDLPPTNLSFHFKALVQAGLLTVKQEGRFQRYRPNLSLMRDLVTYLTAECCGGHPECCVDLLPATTGALAFSQPLESGTSTMNVLFLCTGNSCRSILAEALFNHLAPAGWKAMSAGSQPTGKVHPRSLALLAREGISTDGLYSKSWEDLPRVPDVVITVCSNAAGETCPAYLGPVLRSHWGVEDPAHATGSDEEIDAAFMSAYRILRTRVEAFCALARTDSLSDRDRLKATLDRIGDLLP